MKKIVKYSLGCGCVGSLVVTILFVIAFCILFDGYSEGQPLWFVKYHTADDLYKISNVRFPEVCLVDSFYHDCYMESYTREKFILKNLNEKSNLLDEIDKVMQNDSIYWLKSSDGSYIYYVAPPQQVNL